jgi:hypothetical protein
MMSPYVGWQPACFLALVESALHAEFAHYPRLVAAAIASCTKDPHSAGRTTCPRARLAFFDDVEANVAGARRAGLQAHRVTGPDQIAAISEALLEL